ncbi:MAG: response regulator transcription factor [Gammaproteobacteria bacterium]|jgi:two-component system, LuxR family, response regulator FixJ
MCAEEIPTVFVVDDDEDVRNALRWLIESVDLTVATYPSAEAFLAAYTPGQPGCLVLDVRMPGMGGLGLLEHMRIEGIELPTIILTGHADVPIAVRAMKSGAIDFIEKPFTDQDLLDQIQRALREDAKQRSHQLKRAEVLSRVETLTPREREVLRRVVRGQANKVISAELGISERTVETHRKKIMDKMQAKSLAELIQMTLLTRIIKSSSPPHPGNP